MVNKKVHELEERSADNKAMIPYWDKTDAIVAGHKSMRDGEDLYLPKFPDEEKTDYNVRLGLTKFTNIYRDVIEGLASKPFETEISLGDEVPDEIKDFTENVDGAGNNLTIFASETFFNGLNSAIEWIFVDYPKTDGSKIKTMADQKAAKIKPYWSHVLGRNVLEVRSKIKNGEEAITYIRIFEPAVNGQEDRVRIFDRDENDVVSWKLFERREFEARACWL